MALTLSGDDGVAGVNGSATTPAIQGTDTNTGLTFGTDTVNVVTGGSNRTTVDSSGRLLIGETSSTQAGSIDAKAQVVSSDFNAALTVRRNQASDGAPGMLFCKSRGTSNSANVVVNSGDGLGNIRFFGADATGGNDFAEGGAIACVVDGTPGSDDMPGRLEFKTTADGASSPTEAVRIDSSHNLRFNSGYGSVATAYGVRAWVNFNGRNTLSIYDDGGISSITDNGAGDYTVNFDFTMPDINYAFTGSASYASAASNGVHTVEMRTGTARSTSKTTTSIRLDVVYANSTDNRSRFDYDEVNVVFFR